jgi:parallel beta-helix repeat protein
LRCWAPIALVFWLVLFPALASGARCGGAIVCQCGDLVVSDYRMTADLGPCPGHGLSLSSAVALECGGHAITGAKATAEYYGIALGRGTTGATVMACEVSGFFHGIRLRTADRNRLLNNTVHDNGDFTGHRGYGIAVADKSTENLLQGNRIYQSADEGVHLGNGSHRNTLIGNRVHDNFRENIYLLHSDSDTLKENTTWGGTTSLYVKHSSSARIEQNTFRDHPVVVRGDSHDNQFLGNEFMNAQVHFQALKDGPTQTSPARNHLTGGKIAGSKPCIRFSDASGNIIESVLFSPCPVWVSASSTASRVENLLIGAKPDPKAVSLDDRSLLHVGWPVKVSVQDASGKPIGGATVQGFDAQQQQVFEAVTAADGSLPTQTLVQYTLDHLKATQRTPHTLRVTLAGAQATQPLVVDGPKRVVIAMPPVGSPK